jgi:hypothetical protein
MDVIDVEMVFYDTANRNEATGGFYVWFEPERKLVLEKVFGTFTFHVQGNMETAMAKVMSIMARHPLGTFKQIKLKVK